jgi:hypothetical protein
MFLVRTGQTLGQDVLKFGQSLGVDVRMLTNPLIK